MALTTQQRQAERPQESAPQESGLVAFWREVVVDNPVYQREVRAVAIPASYTPEKAEQLREKARTARAKWEALSPQQKLWRVTRPFLVTFVICYLLIPLLIPLLKNGSGGGFIGPIISFLFMSSASLSMSIVAEREKRTWNALLLSRLSPAQILGGKIANTLRIHVFSHALLLTVVLAAVTRVVLPAQLLLLYPLAVLPGTLLTTLAGLEASLWSTSLKEASSKTMGRTAALNFLTLLVCVAGVLASLNLFAGALWLWCLPVLYCAFALASCRQRWRRMLRDIWRAPKDFSG